MKNILILTLIISIASCSSTGNGKFFNLFGSKNDGTEPTQQQESAEITDTHYKLYEVMSTDTVASIARKFSVSPSQIIAINKLPKPYYLEAGSIIKVPFAEQKDSMMNQLDELVNEDPKPTPQVRIGPATSGSGTKIVTTPQPSEQVVEPSSTIKTPNADTSITPIEEQNVMD